MSSRTTTADTDPFTDAYQEGMPEALSVLPRSSHRNLNTAIPRAGIALGGQIISPMEPAEDGSASRATGSRASPAVSPPGWTRSKPME